MADAIGGRPLVCVLGRLRVIGPDGVLRIPSGEAERSLLVFLAVRGGYVHTEHAIEAVWPGLPPADGRTRLRNVLARLRRTCGTIVQREGSCLVLAAETDLGEYQQALAIILRYAGQELAADARYTDWADDVRHELALVRQRLARLP